MSQTLVMLQSFFGALLGASFYVLLRTQPYLVNRSYDPKYNGVYITRIITGVVSGMILSIGIRNSDLAKFAPGALAILGGYSAEAVEVILKRLVDVVLVVFQGDTSDHAKTRAVGAEQTSKSSRGNKMGVSG